ncbi:MAG: nucleoside deaminase [Bdellovibrionota bacterium]|nr:nucleoside deaminase [Bdellovibrionota bacterium]
MIKLSDHLWNIGLALEEAENAFKNEEVPVGVIITDEDGRVITKSFNQKEKKYNPCGHAEMLALMEAGKIKKNWRLEKCTLYSTLEPCPMCLGAMIHARIETLVFGAYDPKGGAISLGYNLHKDKRLNHNFSVIGGLRHYDCSKILSTFFKDKRKSYKNVRGI